MLISRLEEQKTLRDAYESEYSEFVAVYGRRRVGKTFLIREMLAQGDFSVDSPPCHPTQTNQIS